MSDFELPFLIMVDDEIGSDSLLEKIGSSLPGVIKLSPSSFKWNDNYCQVFHNDDYDIKRVGEDDGYLYYKYRIEVSPIEDITINAQVRIAINLNNFLTSITKKTEICADFEELL